MMPGSLSFYLDSHASRGDIAVFRGVAGPDGIPVSTGRELVDRLRETPLESVDHLVISAHGGSTWLLDDEYGVTTRGPAHRGQVPTYELAEALAPVLTAHPIISLAACMCSRSPRWYLRQRWGTVGSDWGRRAYLPGGQASLSARLRDGLQWHGIWARVRGHRAAGHASALALLAEHSGLAGTPCETLYGRALPDIEPTGRVRRWWTRTVTGQLAQRWLMGDDVVETEIRDAYLRDRG